MVREDLQQLRHDFAQNGVAFVPGALDERGKALAEAAYTWSLENPGPGARDVLAGREGAFYQDHANTASFPAYQPLLVDTGCARLVADIMGTTDLWLLYEQIWLKSGGDTLRTPWHQDLPYVPMAGVHMATIWINLDPVAQENSLEFVRASHTGPLYNPTAFDPNDDKAAMFDPNEWPALPDVEALRSEFDIMAWPVNPGDILVFHPAILHGGAPTQRGGRRRTISLRVFGDDVTCADRPEMGVADVDRLKSDEETDDPIMQLAHKPAGTPFRHRAFHKIA